ncbi:nitroreductase family deazaflavin-dependent oxidoreductase [Terrabacter terrigena]|uniref:Nitroreductase family deazaflavin-dependent oxidoreductase n=1 Tax=Terrabacter terrigena TaxID=574718 RepID=A0ABW3MXN0_9MICO
MAGPPASAKQFNKVAVRLAGHRFLPLWAVLRHTGRKSGRPYRTPVAVVATQTTFLIALPWGRGTDWVRNVRHAGGCTIRWKGRDFICTDPAFVGKDVALAAASGMLRRGIERQELPHGFLQLTRVPAPQRSAMQSGW